MASEKRKFRNNILGSSSESQNQTDWDNSDFRKSQFERAKNNEKLLYEILGAKTQMFKISELIHYTEKHYLNEVSRIIDLIFRTLDETDGQVLRLLYGYGRDIKNSCLVNVYAMTEEEVAEILALSVEKVNQYKRKGIQCIRHSLGYYI